MVTWLKTKFDVFSYGTSGGIFLGFLVPLLGRDSSPERPCRDPAFHEKQKFVPLGLFFFNRSFVGSILTHFHFVSVFQYAILCLTF